MADQHSLLGHAGAASPSGRGSGLARRLIRAEDDPAKEQVRRWIAAIDDQLLLNFGLTTAEIAALRRFRSPARP